MMSGPTVLDALDLAALLCSRVCHDLISPVGAIVNGLEVLDEEGDEETKTFALCPRGVPRSTAGSARPSSRWASARSSTRRSMKASSPDDRRCEGTGRPPASVTMSPASGQLRGMRTSSSRGHDVVLITSTALTGKPKVLISYDIDPTWVQRANEVLSPLASEETVFEARLGDTTEVEIDATDFLFIDTFHTYEQLKKELELHADKVRRFLAFHDTSTFGERGEDIDRDGIVDPGETDPLVADTDQDGLKDGEEFDEGTNPWKADTDEDGLLDGEEIDEYGTSPLLNDTDGDNLADGLEYLIYGTDPLNNDTDSDGIFDGFEILYNLDPFDGNDAELDYDSDGLSNLDEFVYNTHPRNMDTDSDGLNDQSEILTYLTNPNKLDSDFDGLNDSAEVIIYSTNPLIADSDSDGLSDYAEVIVYLTNPNSEDTDGDGATDKNEIQNGSDPNDPNDYPPRIFDDRISCSVGINPLWFVGLITSILLIFVLIAKYRRVSN